MLYHSGLACDCALLLVGIVEEQGEPHLNNRKCKCIHKTSGELFRGFFIYPRRVARTLYFRSVVDYEYGILLIKGLVLHLYEHRFTYPLHLRSDILTISLGLRDQLV